MKKLFLPFFAVLLIFIFPQIIKAQFFSDAAIPDTNIIKIQNQKFGIQFNSLAFFKNNEYFHPLIEGYTLPGFQLQPRLYYSIGENFDLEAGAHFSQFSGKKGLNSFDPLFRATYSPSESFSILLGWLKGTTSHQLIEPLFQWEKVYTDPLEYGVQFLVNKPNFRFDTWIDWEKYIELNDPFQEELTFGTSNKILIFGKNGFEFWIPVQATIKHMGGQVTTVGDPLKTLVNWTTGLNLIYNQRESLIKRINFDFYYVGFNDFSPQKIQAFKNGYGLYPVLSANISAFQASLGYWYGHHFISSKGEPLFQSVSATNPLAIYPNREVVTFKTSFYKQIFKNVSFAAYFESYLDTKIKQMDYSYGISMSVSGDILLKQK